MFRLLQRGLSVLIVGLNFTIFILSYLQVGKVLLQYTKTCWNFIVRYSQIDIYLLDYTL